MGEDDFDLDLEPWASVYSPYVASGSLVPVGGTTNLVPAEPPADVLTKGDEALTPELVAPESVPNYFHSDRWTASHIAAKVRSGELDISSVTAQDREDFFLAAFDPAAEQTFHCDNPFKIEFMQVLLDSAEFRSLQQHTAYNIEMSDLAMTKVSQQYWQALTEQPSEPESEGAMMARAVRAAAAAAKAAASEVEEMQDFLTGMGPAGAGKPVKPELMAKAAKTFRASPTLRKIFLEAGRFRRLMTGMQRRKTAHGAESLVGITLGGPLERTVMSELAWLRLPATRTDCLRRLLSNQAMVYDTRATEKVGKGPVVVTVDESGSMQGDKFVTAKALALTLWELAQRQKRAIALIGYATDKTLYYICTGPTTPVEPAIMLDWLSHNHGGGGDHDVPIYELPGVMVDTFEAKFKSIKWSDADLIMITDAQVNLQPGRIETFNKKIRVERKMRTTALVIESKSAGNLADCCDSIYYCPALSVAQEGVRQVLSI